MIVENTSKDTLKAIATIDTIEKPKVGKYTQSKEDEEIVGYIASRKTQMQTKRSVVDTKWKQYVKQYEALFVPYADGRSASNVPLERAIIELFVAEAVKRPTNFTFTGALDFQFQGQVLEKVWKDDWSVNNRDSVILDNEYLTSIFGTSVIYTGYNRDYRIISDFNGEDEDGNIKFQRKLQTNANIVIENVDIRSFWLDERAKKMEDAIDCIHETYMSFEDFLNLKLDKGYDNEVLNAILPTKSQNDEYRPFLMQEEKGEGEARLVKITKYWNTKLDIYIEIANDTFKIKEHPILNATHSLPFTTRQYGKNLFSIYGYGLPEALVTFKSDINKLREMLMESIKRSNQETIAIGSNLTFDGNQFAYNNQFMKFKGNLQGNFQQLSGTPPNQAIFTYLQELFKQIAIFVGIDIQNILGDAQQTAYQTAVQKESSLQRVNVVLKNRDAAYERLANLHKDNLQMFYPMKMVRKLVNINEDNEEIEEIDEDGNKMGKIEKTYPSIEVPKMKNNKFLDTNEKIEFEITPERIRGLVKIDVSTDLNTPTINEVEKAQRMQFYTGLQQVTVAYQNDPDLEKIIPKKKAILDLAKLNNIEVEQQVDQEVSEKKADLYKELKTMMAGGRTPDISPNQTAALTEGNPADVNTGENSGQPEEVSSIRTPNI